MTQCLPTAARPTGADRGARGAPPLMVHLIDELKVGGAQTHLVTMLREARASYRIEHRVVSLFGDGSIGDLLRADGIAVDVLDLRPEFARGRFLRAAGKVERLLREYRPDVVEAHLTWSRLIGLFAAWRAGVPRRFGFEQGDIYLDSWKFRVANRLGQRLAHRIIVCSGALADWCGRVHGIDPARMAVLHNCVDTERYRAGVAPVPRAGFGFPEGATVFCAVGTLGSGVNKRVDVLIRATAAARGRGADVALVICGDGEQRGRLEGLARDLGVAPFVRFLGMRDDIPAVLAACDALCHAAPFEPFGIVAIEAMGVGLPAVVPDSGGIREAVEDGATGLLYPPLDHDALAAAMARLHEQPGLRRTLGAAAREAVERRFSVRDYVRRLYDIYGFDREGPRI